MAKEIFQEGQVFSGKFIMPRQSVILMEMCCKNGSVGYV